MRTLITILFLSVLTNIYAQKDKSVYIQWHNKGTDNLKLLSTDMTFSDKGKFYYYLSNDNENFYVDLRTLDKDVQRQIQFSGLTVWINMENKKTKNTGFRFPARKENGGREMAGMQGQPAPGGFQGGRNMQMPVASDIEIIGFSDSGPAYISSDEPGNIKGTLTLENSGYLVYELVIPLSKLPEKPEKNNNNDELFSIGLSYQPMPSGPQMSGGGAPSTSISIPAGGGGGRASLGARGAPSRGMSGNSFTPTAESPVMIWFKDIHFATEK